MRQAEPVSCAAETAAAAEHVSRRTRTSQFMHSRLTWIEDQSKPGGWGVFSGRGY